jgi:hypothetical protein
VQVVRSHGKVAIGQRLVGFGVVVHHGPGAHSVEVLTDGEPHPHLVGGDDYDAVSINLSRAAEIELGRLFDALGVRYNPDLGRGLLDDLEAARRQVGAPALSVEEATCLAPSAAGPWEVSPIIDAGISDSARWRDWPSFDPSHGHLAQRIVRSVVERIYGAGFVIARRAVPAGPRGGA